MDGGRELVVIHVFYCSALDSTKFISLTLPLRCAGIM